MSIQSRKVSLGVSRQELYYISRDLFRRNKSFLSNSLDQEYIFTSPKKKSNSSIMNSRPLTASTSNPIKYKPQNESVQKNQDNFDRFFNTSANKIHSQFEGEFAKSRERFLYSRERCTTANTSFNNSQGFQTSPLKQQLSLCLDLCVPSQQSLNKSLSKLSQEHIALRDELQNQTNKLQQSQSQECQIAFMNGYNPTNHKRISATKSVFTGEQKMGAAEIDQLLQDEQKLVFMQQVFSQIEQQKADEQWKNVRYRAPRYTFYKNSERKIQLNGPSVELLDDEKRYNNFSLKKPDSDHTIDMKSSTGRNYKVFNQYKMHDLVYPKSNSQYEKFVYDANSLKCKFDLQKQELNDNTIGRDFYDRQHKHDIASTDLDSDKIIIAKNNLLPFKKSQLPKFNKISARERQSSSPYRLLKNNENPYLHEKKPINKIIIKKCKET